MTTVKVPITDLAARVVELAQQSSVHILTVESCTAGSLATLLADTPGAGDVLLGGLVTYAKGCKVELLGVSVKMLREHTAVSEVVAASLASGALHRCPSADLAVAVTCVGGPMPDDDGNPVGLTYIAVQRRGASAFTKRLMIEERNSGRIRGAVLEAALTLLIDQLEVICHERTQ